MTLRQALETIKTAFPEKGDTELVIRINSALMEFCEITEVFRKSATVSASGTVTLTLPTDFAAMIDVWIESATGDRSSTNLNYEISADGSTFKIQDKYDKNWIIIPTTGVTYVLKVQYVGKPTALTLAGLDSTISSVIPEQYHDAICLHAMELYYMAKGEMTSVKYCQARWEDARRQAKMRARRNYTKVPHEPLTSMEM